MIAFQSIRHLSVVALATVGLAGITASIGLVATARPALAAEKPPTLVSTAGNISAMPPARVSTSATTA